MFPATEAGFHDVFGNVWEWTEDHFNGLEKFDTHFLYDDFSTPCFDGKHNVIMVSTLDCVYVLKLRCDVNWVS